jgi:hypothetical protein
MNRTICTSLIAWPVYLYSAKLSFFSADLPIVKNQIPVVAALIAHSTNAQSCKLPWEISARDDQTEDCLRAGICKD